MRTALMTMLLAGSALAQVNINGFVDASVGYCPDPQELGFSMDQVELDITRTNDNGLTLRADLEFVDDGEGGWDAAVEQGFMNLALPLPVESKLTFGRFNAPIGFECLDAPDMYQYSHALVFDYGLPTNYTGGMLDLALTPQLNLALILANAWDANTETDMEKTFGGRLSASFGDLNIGLSWIVDPELQSSEIMIDPEDGSEVEIVTEDNSQTVFDIDVAYTMNALTLGAEYNMGTYTDAADEDYSWSGFLVMGHYDFNDFMGLTLRYDMFDDGDNVRVDPNEVGMSAGNGFTYSAITIAPTFVLGENMGAVLEFRMDTVDKEIWQTDDSVELEDGTITDLTDTKLSIALELTYTF